MGCSNPLDRPFNRETAESDFTRIVKLDKIDSAEAATMAAFMVEKDLIGTQVLEIGATYRDILEQAVAEAKEKAEQAEAEVARKKSEPVVANYVAATLELLPQVPVNGIALSALPLKFRLLLENKSGKRMKAVKGRILVADTFGETIHTIDYRILDPMEPGERIDRTIQIDPAALNNPGRILDYQRSIPITARWESVDFRF